MGRILGEILGRLQTLHLWDGSDFRNLKCNTEGHALVDNIHDIYRLDDVLYMKDTLVASSAGTKNIYLDPGISSGFCVITSILAYDRDSSPDSIWLDVDRSGDVYFVNMKHSPAAYEAVQWSGLLVLDANSRVRVVFLGVNAGDTLVAHAVGFLRGA